jgi:uncharacterized integral membrane protein
MGTYREAIRVLGEMITVTTPPQPGEVPPQDQMYPQQPSAPPPAPPQSATTEERRPPLRRTRASATWVGVIIAALILIALLIFIVQNSGQVSVHFFGFRGRISLAVALLLAAIAGIVLVAIPGTVRIVQLRRAVRRQQAEAERRL